eukprot:TRINITY_DN4792_c0_g1_i2.p1 TRINITY_DN4792_c0_g1~~TRINITY_DN4792_c0_g1_i2.p1  ORF type:complete len:603 (+),score=162.94 TRINITY_DN4792_c0_g1_i2:132-1940(+)
MSAQDYQTLLEKPDYSSPPGPTANRKCQDVLFLGIFAAFLVGMLTIASTGFDQGRPERLLYGKDMDGRICGVDSGLSDKEYLYWLDPISDFTLQVCVSECPAATVVNATQPDDVVCVYSYQPETPQEVADGLARGLCFSKYESTSLFYRCVPLDCPDGSETCSDAMESSLNNASITRLFADIQKAWPVILGCSLAAFLIGFLWLFLLRKLAGVMVWATIVCSFAMLIAITASLYSQASAATTEVGGVSTGEDSTDTLKAFAYLMTAVTILAFFALAYMAKRINFCVGIIEEATRAMTALPMLVLFPFFPAALIALFALFWIYAAIYIASSGEYNEDKGTFELDNTLRYSLIYHFFALLWVSAFIVAVAQTTIAGAVSAWYWSRDKRSIGSSPVSSALVRTLRYHSGSLALGSLVLAIVQFIRAALHYVSEKTKQEQEENFLLKIVCSCAKCLAACFERFIQFLNENAYIEIAVYGYSFCESSRRAFSLLLRNILRVATINTIGDFLLFLGKIFIGFLCSLIAFWILQENEGNNGVQNPLWPCLIVFLVSFSIGSVFMSVMEMTIDTILLCFCEDCERNDGSVNKPFYMSDDLKAFVEKTASK